MPFSIEELANHAERMANEKKKKYRVRIKNSGLLEISDRYSALPVIFEDFRHKAVLRHEREVSRMSDV